MKQFLLLLFLPVALFSANILSYNLYDRSDRVDLMITFDTPFDGTLRQVRQNDKIVIKLGESSIDAPKVKNLTSPFLTKLTITPISGETQIIAKVPASVGMQASKTSDGYGLRLRFAKTAAQPEKQADTVLDGTRDPDISALPTKQSGEFTQSYYIVVAILVIGIVVLLLIKRRMNASAPSIQPLSGVKPWFAKKAASKKEQFNIRFQKALDPKNRVVMIDYDDKSYLLVVGNSNVLLDKFGTNAPESQNEFEEMLQNKHEELDKFLQIEKEKEPLQSYKEKASGLDFDELIDRQ